MHFWDQHENITNYYEKLTKSICEKYNLTQMEYDNLGVCFIKNYIFSSK